MVVGPAQRLTWTRTRQRCWCCRCELRRHLQRVDATRQRGAAGRWSRTPWRKALPSASRFARPSVSVAPTAAHWIEGIGEVITSDNSEEFAGLAVDHVDDRHRDIEERIRLLELKRRERERIEFLSKINDVLAVSVDLVEIVQQVTTSVIPTSASGARWSWPSTGATIGRGSRWLMPTRTPPGRTRDPGASVRPRRPGGAPPA